MREQEGMKDRNEIWRRYGILLMLAIMVVVFVVGLVTYLTHIGARLSDDKQDWYVFGSFFWGLGTMLIGGMNVYMMYKINSTIENNRQRKELYEIQKDIIDDLEYYIRLFIQKEALEQYKVKKENVTILMKELKDLSNYDAIFPCLNDEKVITTIHELIQQDLILYYDDYSADSIVGKMSEEERMEFTLNLLDKIWRKLNKTVSRLKNDWYVTVNKSLQNKI